MMITDRNRGMLFFALGAFFPIVFLVAGGVLTATNGGYRALVFIAAYLPGLAVLGPTIYKSTAGAIHNAPGAQSKFPRTIRGFLPAILCALSLMIPLVIFRSDVFANELGMHIFLIGTGVALSLFVPLSLGMMHRTGEQNDARERRNQAE